MTLSSGSVLFVVIITTNLDIITSADYNGSEDNSGQWSISTWNDDYWNDYDYNYSNKLGEEYGYPSADILTGNKRSKTETSSSSGGKRKQNLFPKYSKQISPITPTIDEKMAETLSGIEKDLITNENGCKWENFESLTEKEAIYLCIEAWKIELREIPEINIKPGMRFDCGPSVSTGSKRKYQGPRYRGYIRYYKEKIGAEFIPDMLRCNCATLAYKTIIAARNSRRFFFLLKHTGNMYIILTSHGELRNKEVKVVNYREIVVPKE